MEHQADLVAESGHQMQHPLVDRPSIAGEELDDRRYGLALAHREGGDRVQPRGDRHAHPWARIVATELLDPDRLPACRGAAGRILAQLQDRGARRLDHRRSADRFLGPDRPAMQRRPYAERARRHHPVHRQRPVELRGDRPKNLGHRLVERGVLQQNARSGLLNRQPTRIFRLGTPTHRRHFNDESRRCFPAAKNSAQMQAQVSIRTGPWEGS